MSDNSEKKCEQCGRPDPDSWSDKKKWTRDLWTSVISYLLITLFTIGIFMLWLDRKQHRWQAKYDLRLEAFKDYEKKSGLYLLNAYDAVKDAYSGKTKDNSDNIKKWQKEDYDEMKVAQQSLHRWFAKDDGHLAGLLYQLDSTKGEFHKLIKFLNSKLKNDTVTYLRIHTDSLWEKEKDYFYKPIKDHYTKLNEEILIRAARKLD